MADKRTERGASAYKAFKRGAESAANGVHQATSFVSRNDGKVADGAQSVTRAVGSSLGQAGQNIATAGQQASQALHGSANRAANAVRDSLTGTDPANGWRKAAGGVGWLATKVLAHTAGVAADAVNILGKGTAITGRAAERYAPAVGGTVGGLVRGAVDITSNAVDAAALPASSIGVNPTYALPGAKRIQ